MDYGANFYDVRVFYEETKVIDDKLVWFRVPGPTHIVIAFNSKLCSKPIFCSLEPRTFVTPAFLG